MLRCPASLVTALLLAAVLVPGSHGLQGGPGTEPYSQANYCCVLQVMTHPGTILCNLTVCVEPGVDQDCEKWLDVEPSTMTDATCKYAPEYICTRMNISVQPTAWGCLSRQADCPSGYARCYWAEVGYLPAVPWTICYGGDLCGL